MTEQSTHSTFPWRLLTRVYGRFSGEALVGDMQEEYAQRYATGSLQARCWLASQYLRALSTGVALQCGTPRGLSRIMIAATVVLMPIIVGLVAWLSNMDETTPQLWEMVLAGEMHKTLFVSEYWQDQPIALSRMDSLGMFVNFNSALWTLVAMSAVIYVANRGNNRIVRATLLGVVLMTAPYVLGIVYLEFANLPPKKIGPIIAFTLFNVFYMLPVMAGWLHRQANKASLVDDTAL